MASRQRTGIHRAGTYNRTAGGGPRSAHGYAFAFAAGGASTTAGGKSRTSSVPRSPH